MKLAELVLLECVLPTYVGKHTVGAVLPTYVGSTYSQGYYTTYVGSTVVKRQCGFPQ